MKLNQIWEQYLKSKGADFVHFIDTSVLPTKAVGEYICAVLFGKALSKDYVNAIRNEQPPKTKEVLNTERKMDTLAVKLAEQLEADGYKSVGKLRTGVLPHKTVALRAGLGFIGKNNLLISEQYGCAFMMGRVLTTAPFVTTSTPIKEPQCGDCGICIDVCPTNALLGKMWSATTAREEILVRKHCTLCLKCMVHCPYTEKYAKKEKQ